MSRTPSQPTKPLDRVVPPAQPVTRRGVAAALAGARIVVFVAARNAHADQERATREASRGSE